MSNHSCLRAILVQGVFLVGMMTSAGADQLSARFVVLPKALECSPKVLRPGQPLIVNLTPGAARELAIERQGDSSWYYLVIGSPHPGTRPLMTPDAFEKGGRIVIPADIVGAYKGEDARVFTRPGKYTVYVSDNLESEEPGYRCEIQVSR